MLNSFWSKRLGIGLNIQPDRIDLIKVTKMNHKMRPISWITKHIDHDIFHEGKIANWDLLSILLKEIILEHRLKNDFIALQIPSSMTRMQYIKLPVGLSENEILQEIELQIQRDFPGIQDRLYIDYAIEQKTELMMEILYVAAKAEYIKSYIECVNKTGLIVKVIDIDALILWQLSISQFGIRIANTSPIFIYHAGSQVHLIIFNRSIVTYRQQWHVVNDRNYLTELTIKLNQTINKHIHTKIILYTSDVELIASLQRIDALELITPCLKNIFAETSLHVRNGEICHALLSFGLAMRNAVCTK